MPRGRILAAGDDCERHSKHSNAAFARRRAALSLTTVAGSRPLADRDAVGLTAANGLMFRDELPDGPSLHPWALGSVPVVVSSPSNYRNRLAGRPTAPRGWLPRLS